MIVIDPFDENQAADEDGTPMGAVRWIPIKDNGQPPKMSDFDNAPIMGYARPDGITYNDEDEPA